MGADSAAENPNLILGGRDAGLDVAKPMAIEPQLPRAPNLPRIVIIRTPVRESRLKQVEANERGEEIPVQAHPIAEREAQQHKRAGNHTQITVRQFSFAC